MAEKNVESDLGLKDEMSFAIGNMIQAEEHLCMTVSDTKNKDYLPILSEIRKLRAKYLKRYIGDNLDGQKWCLTKHILSIAYRLTEVATKNVSLGRDQDAVENLVDSKEMFQLSIILIDMGAKHGNDRQPKKKDKH